MSIVFRELTMRSSQIDAYHKTDNNAINLITRFRKIDVWVLFGIFNTGFVSFKPDFVYS